MGFNPDQRIQAHVEKHRQDLRRHMQMGWLVQERAEGAPYEVERGGFARLVSFILTLAVSVPVLIVVLAGAGFLITGLITRSSEDAVMGSMLGALIALVLALAASYRAATT